MDLKPWMMLLLALLGNCGWWLFCFNRINATGLPRTQTKFIEKLFISVCFGLPLVIAFLEWPQISDWLLHSGGWLPAEAGWFNSYGVACIVGGLVLGAWWLESRLWMIPPKNLLSVQTEDYHVDRQIEGGTAADAMTSFLNILPGNQIGHLQVTRKHLLLPREIPSVEGFKIGHISDLHFTGQYRLAHYHFVIDRLLERNPDLIVVSGDIIDYDHCLSWIEPLLGRLAAPYGCSFVLGNHDRRVTEVGQLASRIRELGHFDLGKRRQIVELASGARLVLVGNELPWLERHDGFEQGMFAPAGSVDESLEKNTMRIAVSHSPDQIAWARRQNCDLMLAGHTHGGQVRFPGIGPIVSPSFYGSRFASGVFYLKPTLMHVSRGVAGTHPLRWWCKPEISELVLCNQTQD